MDNEKKPKAPMKSHSLRMEDRGKLTVSGVEDVESFDENEIIMLTSRGDLTVRGSGLHIGKISLDESELRVEGLITELSYEDNAHTKVGFWSRVFG